MNIRDFRHKITLFNSLSKTKEEFKPIKPEHATMYHCGPTVYNYIHVGNIRAFIVDDLIRRLFEFNGYTVTQVMNITDIGHLQSDEDDGEDKMTLALKREGKTLGLATMREVANKYYDAFRSDLEKVNVLPAHFYPFASDHIADDIAFIEKLIEQKNAYATSDGIYFDTASLSDYGRLGGISNDENTVESRIDDEHTGHIAHKSEKRNFRDFAVWKFNPELGYPASFGQGFPGWHIECSVMSMKYLGDTFDIHSGGVDHISVHHNNEIAQSEAISGELLANYWMHNAHVIIEGGKKMAKSGESFITLETLTEKGISPMGFRYWLLGASYRTAMQFGYPALEQAESGYKNMILKIARLMIECDYKEVNVDDDDTLNSPEKTLSPFAEEFIDSFTQIINDDMNTARALAYLHEEVLRTNTSTENKTLTPEEKIEIIRQCDHALGLALIIESLRVKKLLSSDKDIPTDIRKIADERVDARKNKDWKQADALRDQLAELGYEVKDTDQGYTLEKRLV